jgi:glycosyltransferase involved in cell wall biosynthesis
MLLPDVGVQPDEPYFLHVGGNHWYKNRRAAVEIFVELRKLSQYADAKLVIAGGAMTPALQIIVRKHHLESAVIEAVGLSNKHLQALYSCALAMVFPSLEEGFGWPILESQACGCPVAITDRAPMNDVAGGAAILIDPAKPRAAAGAIASALRDPSQLRAAGLRNAASHCKERMMEQCEALYREEVAAVLKRG